MRLKRAKKVLQKKAEQKSIFSTHSDRERWVSCVFRNPCVRFSSTWMVHVFPFPFPFASYVHNRYTTQVEWVASKAHHSCSYLFVSSFISHLLDGTEKSIAVCCETNCCRAEKGRWFFFLCLFVCVLVCMYVCMCDVCIGRRGESYLSHTHNSACVLICAMSGQEGRGENANWLYFY